MSRLNTLLLLALMASALYLVHMQYQSRRLFSELDRTHAQGRKLALEHERLQVEKRAQATSARIERLAKDKLRMRAATPAITTYVQPKDLVAPTSSATPAVTKGKP
jgi:cell division protein FtsL